MTEKASPELYSSNEELSLSQSTPLQSDKLQAELEVKLDKAGQSYIEVNCGDISGGLYLEKLKRTPNSRALEKCILSNSSLYTPQEFESMDGKKANKAWKKSIKHKGIPLQKLLASGALKEQGEGTAGAPKDQEDATATQAETYQQRGEGQLIKPRGNTDDMEEMFAELTRKLTK